MSSNPNLKKTIDAKQILADEIMSRIKQGKLDSTITVPVGVVDSLISTAELGGRLEELDNLRHNASGGGSWRRVIETRIAQLSTELLRQKEEL